MDGIHIQKVNLRAIIHNYSIKESPAVIFLRIFSFLIYNWLLPIQTGHVLENGHALLLLFLYAQESYSYLRESKKIKNHVYSYVALYWVQKNDLRWHVHYHLSAGSAKIQDSC